MSIILHTPSGSWQSEKRYVADCVLQNFLGIRDAIVQAGTSDEWVLFDSELGEPGRCLRFPNLFFPEREPASYLTPTHLEQWAGRGRSMAPGMLGVHGYPSSDIPVFFAPEACRHVSDIDLFGTIFFYLSRYEECVLGPGDEIGRFVSGQSVVREFHARPVVDEYVWLIRHLLERTWPGSRLVAPDYKLLVSHDVDIPHSWIGANAGTLLRAVAKCVWKEASPRAAVRTLRSYWDASLDPIYCFNWMMDEVEAQGLQSTYYFLNGGTHPLDVNYGVASQPIISLLASAAARGHAIGLHGSINSAYDGSLMRLEKQALEAATGNALTAVRQHYLRFSAPDTWRIIVSAGLTEDSTLGYADRAGFRCGTARRYPVFDIKAQAMLPVFETPLLCMEQSLLEPSYQGLSPDQAYDYATSLVDQVRAYGGNFSLLWHNHNLVTGIQRDLFRQILKYAS